MGFVETIGIKDIGVPVSNALSCFTRTSDPIAESVLDPLDKGESTGDYAVSVYVEGTK